MNLLAVFILYIVEIQSIYHIPNLKDSTLLKIDTITIMSEKTSNH